MRKSILAHGAVALSFASVALTLTPTPGFADDKTIDIGVPIHSLRDVEETAKILFKLADTNNDGQISQKEATDAGNLLVGGFFFRADANGDGVLTPDEARQARESLFAQQPLLRFVMQRARPTNAAQTAPPGAGETPNTAARVVKSLAADPGGTIGNLLDTNRDQKLEATELRQGVQSGVQGLFILADTNQDGQLSPYELNAAAGEVARSAIQTAFQTADSDRNGALSQDEYDKALTEPAHAVFRVLDANGDNQLSYDEIQRAERILTDQMQRLQVPDQPNSLSNRLDPSRRTNANRGGSGAALGSPSAPAQPATDPASTIPAQAPASTPPAPRP